MVSSLPLLSCESSVSLKENPDRKKNSKRATQWRIQKVSDASIPFKARKLFAQVNEK